MTSDPAARAQEGRTLSRGARLDSFEIVEPLGAGGMGEVYRAKDLRLGREVAIKVLPIAVSIDLERVKRFEKEARSASALNHPNIVTVHDAGTTDGVAWIAMELVEGQTLRQLVSSGAMATKRLLAIAPQIAEGLATAHEVGIVHRDLKPENVMVTKTGLVKILDFGLAKLTGPVSGSGEHSHLPTVTGTSPGIVLGTVGYMSPEQAAGHVVDFRSDQFSFGAILYEMATGRRAFQKKTAVDTLSAILNEEPEPLATVSLQTPAPLRWLVERCLAKEPRERYASTEDVARDLASLRDHLSEVSGAAILRAPSKRLRTRPLLIALALAAVATAGYLVASLRARPVPQPRFQRVTFQNGGLWRARFADDGQTVVYSMTAVGDDLKPPELFSVRVGNLDSRSLGLPPADIWSVSSTGQMAIMLSGPTGLGFGEGTLAETSLAGGGTPRQVLDDVRNADWTPDGKELAILHRVGDKVRIEFPIGNVVSESPAPYGEPRVSPDGRLVAFAAPDGIKVVDRKSAVKAVPGAGGTLWSPRGDEIWWLKAPSLSTYAPNQVCELHATSLTGHDRLMAVLPGDYILQDISRTGRLLLERDETSYEMLVSLPGQSERSLAWLDHSVPGDLSADGRVLLFTDRGDAAGASLGVYLRRTDGSPAVRIGEGSALALSPDGKWALAIRAKQEKAELVLLPTGAGQEKVLSLGGVEYKNGGTDFHPDGRRIYFRGIEAGHRERAYELSIDGGPPRPVTPEGTRPRLLSPDGETLLMQDIDNDDLALYSIGADAGTASRIVERQSTVGVPVHWHADGRSVLMAMDGIPIRFERLDLSSGRRTFWRAFSPAGRIGMGGGTEIALSANEDAWVLGYERKFSEVVVVDGLK